MFKNLKYLIYINHSILNYLIGVFEFNQIVNIGVDLLFWRVAISSIIPMEELLINFLFSKCGGCIGRTTLIV